MNSLKNLKEPRTLPTSMQLSNTAQLQIIVKPPFRSMAKLEGHNITLYILQYVCTNLICCIISYLRIEFQYVCSNGE